MYLILDGKKLTDKNFNYLTYKLYKNKMETPVINGCNWCRCHICGPTGRIGGYSCINCSCGLCFYIRNVVIDQENLFRRPGINRIMLRVRKLMLKHN